MGNRAPRLLAVIVIILLNAIPAVSAADNSWANADARLKFKQTVMAIYNTYHPLYFAIGLEVNTYYQYHPDDFANFVSLYTECYDAIRASPGGSSTAVYPVFQLERMQGIGTAVGYSGVAQWAILDQFGGKIDLLVFTTYPEVEYATPADIPSDYYTGIYASVPGALQSRKIAFSEIGWNSDNLISVTGTSNSYLSQVAFIDRFAVLVNPLKDAGQVEFVVWAYMHDTIATGTFDPFRTIGLKDCHGDPKGPANDVWNEWKSFGNIEESSFKIGIGPIPRNFPGSSAADWMDMYTQVPDVATLLLAQTEWYDTPDQAGEIPQLFPALNAAYSIHHAQLVYGINFFTQDGNPLIPSLVVNTTVAPATSTASAPVNITLLKFWFGESDD